MTSKKQQSAQTLFFVRSGLVYSNSTLDNPGRHAWYWSHSSSSSTYAFALYVNNSNVRSSYNGYRYYGMSVRCLYPST